MKFILLTLIPIVVFAQSYLISNIALPKTYIMDNNIEECDEVCKDELLQKGQVFSFLINSKDKLEDDELNDQRLILTSLFNLDTSINSNELKIALLLPYKKIGRYASSTTNSAFLYLLTKSREFELKTYELEDESSESLDEAFAKIIADGFSYVIAPLTKEGVQNVAYLEPDVKIYFPTINKNNIDVSSEYMFFGGIDYKAQIEELTKLSVAPLVTFKDTSALASRLTSYAKASYFGVESEDYDPQVKQSVIMHDYDGNITIKEKKFISNTMNRYTSNLAPYLKDKDKIIGGSFLLNAPVVKSSMVLTQLTLFDVNATNSLSTQINYDPMILSITQLQDRKNFYIANSISKNSDVISESNFLLRNDIVYDWINYATTIGVDYFYNMITGDKKEYDLAFVDNQVVYPIQIVKASLAKFEVVDKEELQNLQIPLADKDK